MIGAMLDQSERVTTERQLRDEATGLAELVEVGAAELERLWNASPDLIVVATPEGVYCRANPAWLTIARDAMDGEGQLGIAVEIVGELPALRRRPAVRSSHVAISITDTGTGIPAEQIERVFEPFFTTKGVGHGTGLSLSQVFGFAKQSGGDVAVDSEVGRGTTFTLYLPLALAEQPARVAECQEAQTLEAGTCVLVVEDNREVGEFATHALAELGLGSHWVADAEAALAELRRAPESFDIVFTDVVTPGRSGIDLAEEIVRLRPDLPVVLTSGYSHVLAQEGTQGLQLLRKPYSIDELADVLARAKGR